MNLYIVMRRPPAILIIMAAVLTTIVFAQSTEALKVPGPSPNAWGAGMAVTNFDSNPRPELILMVYDISRRPNTFHYRIGWNVDSNGVAKRWGDDVEIPGIGWIAIGAGMALGQLDNDPRPEMILMIYYDFDYKTFRYKVGWNLDSKGLTTNWSSDFIEIPGVGWFASGAGTVIAQLDDNPKPDLVIMGYDDFSGFNFFRYRVGWNLDSKGKAATWSNYKEAVGVFDKGGGAGITIAHMDDNPAPELIVMAYKISRDQSARFCYRTGWNLDSSAMPTSWSIYSEVPGVGPDSKGGDIAVFNLDDDERPEFIFMSYINPSGGSSKSNKNYWSCRVAKNIGAARRIRMEMDKLDSVKWPSDKVVRQRATHSLHGIYTLAGIGVNPVQDDGLIPDIKEGKPYTDAEIHSFLTAYRDDPVPEDAWPLYAGMLTTHTEGLAGMMFTLQKRRGAVVFAGQCNGDAEYLLSLARQMGMALNLRYSDGDAWRGCFTYSKGHTIMNPVWRLAEDWNFAWSPASLSHFYYHLYNRWEPQQKEIFINCH